MIIGLLGPTNVKKYCDILGFELSEYKYFLEKIAEHLAKTGHEIIIMPSQNQTSQSIVAQTYKDYRGKKVIGIIPMDDTEWGLLDIDEHFADENINCGTWRNQPETFCEKSDILLVIGLSPGAMIELCYTKWFKVEKQWENNAGAWASR